MKRMWIGAGVIAVSGFMALSYELVWYRMASFAASNTASAFPLLLGSYLVGIAFGALGADRIVETGRSALHAACVALLATAVIGALAGAAFAQALVLGLGYYPALAIFAVAATGLGFLFPLLSHWAIPPDAKAGARVSYLYAANIVGSVAGTIITGFVLLDMMKLHQITALLATVSVLLFMAVAFQIEHRRKQALAAAVVVMAGIWLALPALYEGLWTKLFYWDRTAADVEFVEVYEGRGGVVTTTDKGRALSGGVYDGTFSVDLADDTNGIARAFVGPLLHPQPKRILCIGLATGSWAVVLANAPGVEKLTLIEIESLWPRVIENRAPQNALFDDPRVEWVFDDARRWLNANKEEKFDLVIANVSYHWRSHASLLLSREFQILIREHLEPGGIYLFNTTDSPNVWATTLDVFPHVWRVYNAAVASTSPLHADPSVWEQRLDAWTINGQPVADEPEARELMRNLAVTLRDGAGGPESLAETMPSLQARFGEVSIITDDNMGNEWMWNVVPRSYWLGESSTPVKANRWSE